MADRRSPPKIARQSQRRRALLDAERKTERDREQAALEAAKEKVRTDRLAARFDNPSSNDIAAATTMAAAEGVERAETSATSRCTTRAERERRPLEGAGYDPDKRATPEEIKSREEKRRTAHRETTQTRGDEGIDR